MLVLDLDYILPFATVPENGRKIDGLHDKFELSHHIMTLVNLLRILSAVKTKKASRHFVTRPTQVILLLSLNHGLFGNDGLYLESKISLEMLFNCWNSESWSEYCAWLVLLSRKYHFNFILLLGGLCYIGGPAVQVSWDKVERQYPYLLGEGDGVQYPGHDAPIALIITQAEPIWADLNSGMDRLPDLTDITSLHPHSFE
jgi:3-oxoacyl-ACP reductase-like protein